MTPAKRHFEKMMAAKRGQGRSPSWGQNAHQLQKDDEFYQLMMVRLTADIQHLKEIQSIEKKIAYKREILPAYAAWVEGALRNDTPKENDRVLMTVMVWRIDAGDFEGALAIGKYALEYNLSMPDQYQRGTAAVLTEEISKGVLKELEKQPNPVLYPLMKELEQAVVDLDMHDQIRARMLKAAGFASRDAGAPSEAVKYLKEASQLDARIGVKKEIAALEKLISAQPHDGEQTESTPTPGGRSDSETVDSQESPASDP